ncbi:MAG TPA: dihydroorotate dehydrogenase [Candidatus Dormibacteraeota bacterium]|nr:dihydroorotate dehydrogenase [Candidatus Dormibacteraeota bacterium]
MSTEELRVDLGRGLVLPNPVGLASGTAGYGFELRHLIDLDRLGALFTKGTTRLPRSGNAPPRLAETAGGGLLNSIGLQNPGVDWVAMHYAPRFSEWRIPVIVNIAGENAGDYVHCVRRLEGITGIAGIELNISCPNIAHGLDFGRDPTAAARLVQAVRRVTERSVTVKLSPNVTDIAAVARAVQDAGADSVSAVNTYVGMKIHRRTGRPVLPDGTGGLSGPAIQPLALAAVAAVRAAVRIPVVGVGGIMDTASAGDYFVAGADAVQVGTATFVDPGTALQVLEGIEARGAPARAGLSARPATE